MTEEGRGEVNRRVEKALQEQRITEQDEKLSNEIREIIEFAFEIENGIVDARDRLIPKYDDESSRKLSDFLYPGFLLENGH